MIQLIIRASMKSLITSRRTTAPPPSPAKHVLPSQCAMCNSAKLLVFSLSYHPSQSELAHTNKIALLFHESFRIRTRVHSRSFWKQFRCLPAKAPGLLARR